MNNHARDRGSALPIVLVITLVLSLVVVNITSYEIGRACVGKECW